jgi:hypothetical protein
MYTICSPFAICSFRDIGCWPGQYRDIGIGINPPTLLIFRLFCDFAWNDFKDAALQPVVRKKT